MRSLRWLSILALLGTVMSSALAEDGIRDEKDLNFDAIVRIIQKNNIQSIDALLPLLPESYRRGYALVYKSRSLQDASPENPRAIVFGSTARLVISFNGASTQKGFNDLEVMEFDEKTAAFNLHEINFPPAGTSKPAQISQVNPNKCIACHSDPPRPIWDNYPEWPGVYGASHGILSGGKDDGNFRKFVAQNQSNTSRYARLPDLEIVKERAVDNPPVQIEKMPQGKPYDVGISQRGDEYDNVTHLNDLLIRHNYLRIFRALKANANYDRFKYALAAAVDGCDQSLGIEKFLPSEMNEKMRKKNISAAEVKQGTIDVVEAYLQKRKKRLESWDATQKSTAAGPDEWKEEVQLIIPARYVLLSQGLDIGDWSMTAESPSYTLGQDQGGVHMLEAPLVEDLIGTDPDLKQFIEFRHWINAGAGPVATRAESTLFTRPQYCELLRQKSIRAFKGTASKDCAECAAGQRTAESIPRVPGAAELGGALQSVQALPRAPLALDRCIQCHTGTDSLGPNLPFNDPESLGKSLKLSTSLKEKIHRRLNSSGSDRMPPGRELGQKEIREIEDYLKSLAK